MVYVTSDLHGYPHRAFLRLLDKAGFSAEDTLAVLGDVIDRNGDGGVETFRWIMAQPNVQMIRGNHENMMIDVLADFAGNPEEQTEEKQAVQRRHMMLWLQNGGGVTLQAMLQAERETPGTMRGMLEYALSLPYYLRIAAGGRKFLLVHSGLENFSPDRELDDYTPDELVWHRPDPDERYFEDELTVFGHTPTGYRFGTAGRMYRTDTWADIDTGAAGSGSPMVLRLDDMREYYAGRP